MQPATMLFLQYSVFILYFGVFSMNRLKYPHFLLAITGISVPLVFAKYQFGLFTITIIEPFILILAMVFITRLLKEHVKAEPNKIEILFFLLIFWMALSLPKAINLAKSFREFMLFSECSLTFYMIRRLLTSKEGKFNLLLRIWSYGAIFVGLIGISLLVNHVTWFNTMRNMSTFLNPNSLSGYLVLFLPIMFGLAEKGKWHQQVFWSLFGLGIFVSLTLTYTRGGVYASLISLVIMALVLRSKHQLFIIGSIIFLLAFTPGVGARIINQELPPNTDFSFNQSDSKHISPAPSASSNEKVQASNEYSSSYHRILLWRVGLEMWQNHPVTGVGTGNYVMLYRQYAQALSYKGPYLESLEPHNSFIKILAENGIIGLALFVTLLACLGRQIISYLFQNRENLDYPVVLGTACGVLAFILQGNTNSLFHDTRVAFTAWLILGLLTWKTEKVETLAVHPETVIKTEKGLKHNYILGGETR